MVTRKLTETKEISRKDCQQYEGKSESDVDNSPYEPIRVFNGKNLPSSSDSLRLIAKQYTPKSKLSQFWENYKEPIIGAVLTGAMIAGVTYAAVKSSEISNKNHKPSIERKVGE